MWHRAYRIEPSFKLPAYTWDEDKKQCLQCKHCITRDSKVAAHPTPVMQCRVAARAGVKFEYCFHARIDGDCGRQARLFEPKD